MDRSAIRNDLRAVERMLRRWDPIGIIPDPDAPEGPLDEYDSYAPGVLKQLRTGADVEELAKHLNIIATSRMGLDRRLDNDREFAQHLLVWWSKQCGSDNAV